MVIETPLRDLSISVIRPSAKDHNCRMCGRTIAPTENRRVFSWVNRKGWGAHHTCTECTPRQQKALKYRVWKKKKSS